MSVCVSAAAAGTPGDKLWRKRYDGPGRFFDKANSVVVSPDGTTVYVTGESAGGTSADYATIAYDAPTGDEVWAKRFDGAGHDYDVASSLVVSPDGDTVFVTGHSVGSSGDYDFATFAYNASTGAELWRKRSGRDTSDDLAPSVVVSPDGSDVFVTGTSRGPNGPKYATLAYDASTGAKLWSERYMGPAMGGAAAAALAVSPDGAAVSVTGSIGLPNSYDFATVMYSAATGAKIWEKRFDGRLGYADDPASIAWSPGGTEVFVTGSSFGGSFDEFEYYDYLTIAYDASTGAEIWKKRFDGRLGRSDFATSIAVSPDGAEVFVTGQSAGSTGYSDYLTLAYDASTGARIWTERYEGGPHRTDVAESLAVSPDGTKVFVTGSSGRIRFLDYATIAYDSSTGAELWARRYDGPGGASDQALSLAVSPDGTKVFVTGESFGASYDYATIAYVS